MWFGGQVEGYRFEMFSVSHIVMIALLLIGSTLLLLRREKLKPIEWAKFEFWLAVFLIVFEAVYHIWMLWNHNWLVSHSLPLELCNISWILTILLLFTKKKIFYEILLFTALLGASQAVFTPVLHYDFPHFRFFHFFLTHLIIIWVSLFFTWVKGYRPTIWSIVKLFVFLNVLLPFILLINKWVNGNYMFLSHKPASASLLNYLGPYPVYILSMEALLIVLSSIVWLLFREKDGNKIKEPKDFSIR
ncbi:YwaF family protein [Neobacillus dielmonensis]|uniref:YwaF family protein n=1 Tax=Neobacillus dielmonensis TaxID=1347369 RepID=UPI0005AAF604|nr:TIGR02206 family membrane protein [Neobacillus dielmonensis]